jgi:hypothetical protein
MISKIKMILVVLATFSLFAVPAAVSADSIQNEIGCGSFAGSNTANGYNNSSGCAGEVNNSNTATTGIGALINEVITTFSWIVGGISVIMVIYGGFRYVTSGGNDSSISGAKNTIVYALIGLVIVALAQVIVHFVLSKAFSVGAVYSTHLFR